MPPGSLLMVWGSHAATVTVLSLVIAGLGMTEPTLPLVVGAIIGSYVGGWYYHASHRDAAPAAIKSQVGLCLGGSALLIGLMQQALWHWYRIPEVSLGIGFLGSFAFPFFVFENIRKAMTRPKPS